MAEYQPQETVGATLEYLHREPAHLANRVNEANQDMGSTLVETMATLQIFIVHVNSSKDVLWGRGRPLRGNVENVRSPITNEQSSLRQELQGQVQEWRIQI